jgi:hypothetical protein
MTNRGIKGLGKIRKMNSKKQQKTEKTVQPSCEEPGCGCGN